MDDIFSFIMNRGGIDSEEKMVSIYKGKEAKNKVCDYTRDPEMSESTYLYICWLSKTELNVENIDEMTFEVVIDLFSKAYLPFVIVISEIENAKKSV